MKTHAEEEFEFFKDRETLYVTREKQLARHMTVASLIRPVRDPQSRMSVLDVGCGRGDLIHELPGFDSYLGVDICPNLIKDADMKWGSNRVDITFQVGTVFDLTSKFDAVVAVDIFTKKTEGWKDLVFNTVHKMWSLCNKAVAFTTFHPCMSNPSPLDESCDERFLFNLVEGLKGVKGVAYVRRNPEYVNVMAIYR